MVTYPLKVECLKKIFFSNSFLFLKKKKEFTAVNNISFHLKEGEILGFLGPNGAGKTTTIQMLLNLLTPTSGSIKYFGKNIEKNHKVMQNISYASGYMKLPSSLTVKQALYMQGLLYNMNYAHLKQKVNHFLQLFQIEHLSEKNVFTLSSGQTAIVLLARTFLVEPKIVLLDEPTAALDPVTATNIRNFIKEQNKKLGISILFTSHNMPEVAELCDRILVLKSGEIIADNTPEFLASTVSITKVHLVIDHGMENLLSYLKEKKIEFNLQEHYIEIRIDEHKIATLLTNIANNQIGYSQISIEKPTLEDYFLTFVKRV